MNMNVLVSVILPIYNQEKYLHKSLDSILNQTYKNIEIVTVNDGSTDNSLKILREYEAIDFRIKIVNQVNEGVVGAICTGIVHAKGKYCCFVDPDDYIGDDFVDMFLQNIEDNDLLAMGYYTDYNGQIVDHELNDNTLFCGDELLNLRRHFLCDQYQCGTSKKIFISRWNKMVKRECIIRILEQYKKMKDVSLGDDSIFTYLLLNSINSCKAMKECNSYYYNISSQNSMMSHGSIKLHLSKALIASNFLEKLLVENGDNNTQAYYLYFLLVEVLFQRIKKINDKSFIEMYALLMDDKRYKKALIFMAQNLHIKDAGKLYFRLLIRSGKAYKRICVLFKAC